MDGQASVASRRTMPIYSMDSTMYRDARRRGGPDTFLMAKDVDCKVQASTFNAIHATHNEYDPEYPNRPYYRFFVTADRLLIDEGADSFGLVGGDLRGDEFDFPVNCEISNEELAYLVGKKGLFNARDGRPLTCPKMLSAGQELTFDCKADLAFVMSEDGTFPEACFVRLDIDTTPVIETSALLNMGKHGVDYFYEDYVPAEHKEEESVWSRSLADDLFADDEYGLEDDAAKEQEEVSDVYESEHTDELESRLVDERFEHDVELSDEDIASRSYDRVRVKVAAEQTRVEQAREHAQSVIDHIHEAAGLVAEDPKAFEVFVENVMRGVDSEDMSKVIAERIASDDAFVNSSAKRSVGSSLIGFSNVSDKDNIFDDDDKDIFADDDSKGLFDEDDSRDIFADDDSKGISAEDDAKGIVSEDDAEDDMFDTMFDDDDMLFDESDKGPVETSEEVSVETSEEASAGTPASELDATDEPVMDEPVAKDDSDVVDTETSRDGGDVVMDVDYDDIWDDDLEVETIIEDGHGHAERHDGSTTGAVDAGLDKSEVSSVVSHVQAEPEVSDEAERAKAEKEKLDAFQGDEDRREALKRAEAEDVAEAASAQGSSVQAESSMPFVEADTSDASVIAESTGDSSDGGSVEEGVDWNISDMMIGVTDDPFSSLEARAEEQSKERDEFQRREDSLDAQRRSRETADKATQRDGLTRSERLDRRLPRISSIPDASSFSRSL